MKIQTVYPLVSLSGEPQCVDNVFVLPHPRVSSHELFFWNHREIFGNDHPVCIEYCSGNGEWVIDKALHSPQWNWIAVEKKSKRVKKIAAKRKKHGLDNLVIVAGEAAFFTKSFLPDGSVAAVYINFPDPWPKRRHAKNRLLSSTFIEQLKRIAVSGAALVIVTDHQEYGGHITREVAKVTAWKEVSSTPEFEQDYGSSYFDRLWRSKGRSIQFLVYQKEAK